MHGVPYFVMCVTRQVPRSRFYTNIFEFLQRKNFILTIKRPSLLGKRVKKGIDFFAERFFYSFGFKGQKGCDRLLLNIICKE